MNITNFKRFRINDTDTFVDVSSCGGHSSDGVVLTAYDFVNERVEIRRKERQTAMFVLKDNNTEIPKFWRDAEIVFSTQDAE